MITFDQVLAAIRKCPVTKPNERPAGAPLDPATEEYIRIRNQYDADHQVTWFDEAKKRMERKGGLGCSGILMK